MVKLMSTSYHSIFKKSMCPKERVKEITCIHNFIHNQPQSDIQKYILNGNSCKVV